MLVEKPTCPVCRSNEVRTVVNRNSVPVHQNMLMATREKALSLDRGDLQMGVCVRCGFVFNAAFDENKIGYNEDYDNAQTWSQKFTEHVDNLVDRLVSGQAVTGCHVVEVGCGQGDFLRRVVEKGNNTGTGFDPSYHGDGESGDGRIEYVREYYGEKSSEIIADVVICRHVIEHVPRPLELLTNVRKALANSRHARVYFETPCVNWILKNGVVWDFFYEHCSLFNPDSIRTAFQASGFNVLNVEHVFDGQYLWLEAELGSADLEHSAAEVLDLCESYRQSESESFEQWTGFLTRESAKGKVIVWGAGAKGVTFVNLLDPARALISQVCDINVNKQGKFIAGTGHEIVSPHQILSQEIASVIAMNPNYVDEIANTLNELGAGSVKVVTSPA